MKSELKMSEKDDAMWGADAGPEIASLREQRDVLVAELKHIRSVNERMVINYGKEKEAFTVQRDVLVAALEFYADNVNWKVKNCEDDWGDTACAALAKVKP